MAGEIRTTIERIDVEPGQRILAVSDIHGHFDYFVQFEKDGVRRGRHSGDCGRLG